ncbi:MAG: hypothetical protein NTY09_13670 [bacterium]|nr:hypothetical protein [bacterium]
MEKSRRKLPSLALIVTLVIGLFWTGFSVLESISGFFQRPVDLSAGVGGLMQIVTFSLPFFVTAWLLWVKPKIGAIVLMLMGIGFGIWMFFWNRSGRIDEYIVRGSFTLVPFALGLYTLIRETISDRRK